MDGYLHWRFVSVSFLVLPRYGFVHPFILL